MKDNENQWNELSITDRHSTVCCNLVYNISGS